MRWLVMAIVGLIVTVLSWSVRQWYVAGQRALDTERAATAELLNKCDTDGQTEQKFMSDAVKNGLYLNPRRAELIRSAKALSIGMSKHEVRKSLGGPSWVEGFTDKDGIGFESCEWIYYLEHKAPASADEFDEVDLIAVSFDRSDRVFHTMKKKAEE